MHWTHATCDWRRVTVEQYFYRIAQTAEILGLSRTMAYDLVRRGEIRSVRIAGALRVPANAIEDYAAEIETEAALARSAI